MRLLIRKIKITTTDVIAKRRQDNEAAINVIKDNTMPTKEQNEEIQKFDGTLQKKTILHDNCKK